MPKRKIKAIRPRELLEGDAPKSPLEELPKDTLEYMLSFLSLGDLNNVFPVSKTLNKLSSTERFYSNEKIPKAFMPHLKSKKARLFKYLENEALKEITDNYPDDFLEAMGGEEAFMEVPKFKQKSDITLDSMFGYKMARFVKHNDGYIALCVKKYVNRRTNDEVTEPSIKFLRLTPRMVHKNREFELPFKFYGINRYNDKSWDYLNRLLTDKPCGRVDYWGNEDENKELNGESCVSLTDQLLPKKEISIEKPKGVFGYFQSLFSSHSSSSHSSTKRRKL